MFGSKTVNYPIRARAVVSETRSEKAYLNEGVANDDAIEFEVDGVKISVHIEKT